MHVPMSGRWLRIGLNALLVVWSTCLIGLLTQVVGGGCDRRWQHMARAQLRGLAAKVTVFQEHTGHLPATLEALASGEGDGPYSRPAEFEDPWGAAFYYRADTQHGTFRLFTLGADGRPGGIDDALDIDAEDLALPD